MDGSRNIEYHAHTRYWRKRQIKRLLCQEQALKDMERKGRKVCLDRTGKGRQDGQISPAHEKQFSHAPIRLCGKFR